MMENGRFGNLAVRTKCSIIAIAVTVLFLAANGPATAACEKGKRIRHNGSECLTASWTNRSLAVVEPGHRQERMFGLRHGGGEN